VMSKPLAYLHDQIEQWKSEGTYQRLRVLESASAAESRFDGKDVINLASNNYLGLTTHPKLLEAAIAAVKRYGAGSGAVRTISGTMSLHLALEERIAAFKNVEACVVFQSGFAANAAPCPRSWAGHHIVSDELNHASIVDGCRLSRAKIHVFAHKDVAAAESILASLAGAGGKKLLISDGVFSMDATSAHCRPGARRKSTRHHDGGRRPFLRVLAATAAARSIISASMAGGYSGRNALESYRRARGYVCGSRDLIEFLYHRARPFLFSTSHPPAVAAACLAAFDVLNGNRSASTRSGPTPATSSTASRRWFQHRDQRDAHHAGDCRRSGVGAPALSRAVRGRRAGHRHRFPTVAKAKRACGPSWLPRIAERIWTARWRFSKRSGSGWRFCRDHRPSCHAFAKAPALRGVENDVSRTPVTRNLSN